MLSLESFVSFFVRLFTRKGAPTQSIPADAGAFPFDLETLEQAVRAASRPWSPNATQVAAALRAACMRYGVMQPLEIAHLIAQLAHESMGFTRSREIWTNTAAQLRYETHRGLGNTEPGDGRRFAGLFWVQLTGRWNQSAYATYRAMTVDELQALADDPYTNADASVWYVAVLRKGTLSAARANDIEGVTRAINGGLNGYEDRRRRYALIAPILGVSA